MEKVVFYREWLPRSKAEFNILAMLAEQGGSFSGNYSDMCRYLGVDAQHANRRRIQSAIESLSASDFIIQKIEGRRKILTVIPKETKILLPRLWVQSVIRHDYAGEDVAFAQVLKVFAWIVANKEEIVTNDMIAYELGISASTVVSAKNVLAREYKNIKKRKISEQCGNSFRSIGQELLAGAWWEEL